MFWSKLPNCLYSFSYEGGLESKEESGEEGGRENAEGDGVVKGNVVKWTDDGEEQLQQNCEGKD